MKTRGVPFPWSVYPTATPLITAFTISSCFVDIFGKSYCGEMEAMNNIVGSFAGA
jgi:hypothetical protein